MITTTTTSGAVAHYAVAAWNLAGEKQRRVGSTVVWAAANGVTLSEALDPDDVLEAQAATLEARCATSESSALRAGP